MVNLVLVCVLLSLGRQIPQKHSCFLGDKGLFCHQLIRQVGKVSVVLFERLCPDSTARLGLEGFQHCMVAVSCKPGMKLSFGVTSGKVQFSCENPTEIL